MPVPPPPPKPSPKPPATAPAAAPSPSSAPARPAPPPVSAKPVAARQPAKTFSIARQAKGTEGQKIILYAPTGLGKTTLASMAPNPVFLAFDKNALILHPKTNESVSMVPGIESFQDLRDTLQQRDLFPAGSTIVLDTITKAEATSERYIFDNYPLKNGKATHMRAYGWDGPGHLVDVIRLLLTDFDPHVAAGRNVLILAQQSQATVSNSEGIDYLQDGPRLSHTKQYSSRMEVAEWADHVLRIGFQSFEVRTDNEKARVGKVSGDRTRAIFTGGAAHYLAKSRKIEGRNLPEAISFVTPDDDSLWAMIFHGATPQTQEAK